MGILSNLVGAAVKVAVTPITLVQDVAKTLDGKEPDVTIKTLESAGEDLSEAVKKLIGEDE